MTSNPGPSKRSPPPLDSSECPPAKKTGVAIISSTKDIVPYITSLVAHLTLLGTMLGIEDHAKAIIENGSGNPTTKCLDILKHWLDVTVNPTWNLFCSKLKGSDTFNCVRAQIKEEHGISFDSMTCSLPQCNLTQDELSQLQESEINGKCHVWTELGVTGVGKSCLGNFILGQSGAFPESELDAISETECASMKNTTFDGEKLCVIDTPGLGDTLRLGKHKSKAMDIAEDYSHLITELTKIMLMTKQGISAFLIVITLNRIEGSGLEDLLAFLNIFGDYWNHSVVVVTHGNKLGSTEDARYTKLDDILHNRKCSSALKLLSEQSNNRFVIVEAKELQNDADYRHRVVSKILALSDTITRKHGCYQDKLQSIGNEALENAKLQLRHKFMDMESPEAKAAIFQSTFQHVREVVYKLVKIKLADGEDVDKLKEMAEVKEKELNDIRRQRDLLHEEFLEEQKRRREAEEEQRRLAEEKQKEEERRKQAEEEKRREAERRRKAEEERLREQREKEEAQRKLEEYLKKPTFNERRVEAHVYKSNIYRWKYVHSAEARDVATGITAKAQNYKSKSGAKENAKLNLKAILLDKGIIRKDDI